jgi:hypothetical protein
MVGTMVHAAEQVLADLYQLLDTVWWGRLHMGDRTEITVAEVEAIMADHEMVLMLFRAQVQRWQQAPLTPEQQGVLTHLATILTQADAVAQLLRAVLRTMDPPC